MTGTRVPFPFAIATRYLPSESLALRFLTQATIACTLWATSTAYSAVVGSAVGDSLADNVNVKSSLVTAPAQFPGPVRNGNWVEFSNNRRPNSDNFGLISRDSIDNTPSTPDLIDGNGNVDLFDDSVSIAPGDRFGIVAEGDVGNFFGIVDTVNLDLGFDPIDQDFAATWEFDVTEAEGELRIGIEFAAMGDFENDRVGAPGDFVQFDYSFDGVNFSSAFTSEVIETDFATTNGPFSNPINTTLPGNGFNELPTEVVYTMDDGVQVAYNDPMAINGEPISNEFEVITFGGIGLPSSDTLTLRLTASLNGSSEVVAFRNVVVQDAIPEPTTLALALLAAAVGSRRR